MNLTLAHARNGSPLAFPGRGTLVPGFADDLFGCAVPEAGGPLVKRTRHSLEKGLSVRPRLIELAHAASSYDMTSRSNDMASRAG